MVVQQGEKWRLCHDYSVGTNLYVPSAPFRLPSPWDVRPAVRAGSRFAKYDIRDGFFHVPVHPDSRRRLVVRHPGTGRLLWAPRLPFGYVDSPRLFCGVMEAIADKLRSQVSGRGIHFYVFVYCEQTSTKSLCARPPLTRSEITTSTIMRAFGSTLDWNATHFIACLCYTLLLYT